MAIGEILLSAFLQVLFDKLASLGLDYVQKDGALPFPRISIDQLKKWKKTLDTINVLLDDAEEKQMRGKGPVKLWLNDVRDLAYDMEDLLDEFAIEATQAKLQAESSTSKDRMKWVLPSFGQHKSSVSNLSLSSLVSETEVQMINDRLEEIVSKKSHLGLTENVVARSDYTNKRLPSTSLPEPQFFGREKEEAEILKLLADETEIGDTKLSIVPIVGMGGVGKTALAQRLYEDARVCACFERMVWVCVSDIFDVLNITKTILRSITGFSNEGEDLNGLQVKLKDSLSGKKFLVVLDDVWNENYGEWTVLLKPFEAGAKGSKIIVTTRNSAVVSTTRASPYHLKELSLDYCASLLAFHALGATNFKSHMDFEKMGNKIAKKCKGSPLAAKVLGGLLRDKGNPKEWEDILNKKTWDLPTGKNDEIIQVLKLSYVHLPSYLKRCFVYFAVFPKDYEFEREELVLLWIAEGFLDGQEAKENILKLGWKYFDELVLRSFLQQSSVDKSKFSMHDLLNDLAKSIADKTCFSLGEFQLAGNEDDASLEKARHASLISSRYVTSPCLRAYQRMKVLRSLMLLYIGSSRGGKFCISKKVLHDLLTNFKYLRVFLLCHCNVIAVPKCVGDLKHLRYLNFSYTDIEMLPESIGGLCKLQALILRGCQKLSTLPQGITKLVSLQFFDIRDTPSLKDMPLGISNLKDLIIFSKFVVGSEKESHLKELKNLRHLQGELFISELQRVKEVRGAILVDKKGLSNLILHWDEDSGNLPNDMRKLQVLNFLQPHTNLESLTISYYGGAIFPSWLDGGSYSKVVSLCLRGCRNVTSLPSFGQLPSLKELSLEGLDAVSMIGSEFYGNKSPFPSLQTLKFEEMLAWKDWSPYVGDPEGVPFSCLQHLIVQSCHSLVGTLPCRLDYLEKIEIRSSPHLNISTDVVCFPSVRELHLQDCKQENLKSLAHLSSLTILEIHNLAELVCFDYGLMSCLVELKELYIGGCDKLKYLWQDGKAMLNLTCLQKLSIEGCPQFTSFVVGGGEIELPCNLERMELRYCTNLEKLPSKMLTLRHLTIWNCPKLKAAVFPSDDYSSDKMMSQFGCQLTSFPCAEGRPTTLKTLEICACEGVESLEEIIMESLESLTIDNCENLKSLPQYFHTLSHLTHLSIQRCPALEIEDFPPLPVTLLSLDLWGCPKIKSINIVSCNNLTELNISYCGLEILPAIPITLLDFILINCPKVKSLPNEWHHLTSLQDIHIYDCPSIECFPNGGFPPKLQSLQITRCENVKQPVREWGLPFLTSLQDLKIDGISMGGEGEKVWFPSDADAWSLLFPSSLTSLRISYMRNVERLSSGLRNHLSSLQTFVVLDCPKLRDLPEDGLPPSLQVLEILGCKIPKDRYSQFADEIPLVLVDRVQIR